MRIARLTLLALAAAAVAVVWNLYSTDLARAQARVSGTSQLVETPCGKIEYAIEGSGIPLLLIHGAGGGFDQGLAFGRPLLQSGIRVIAPSRFGYLRAPVPQDTSAQAQADAHACLLDTLGLERVAVLGASAGAPSAMQLCIRHPQRCSALILLVPATYSSARAAPATQGDTRLPGSMTPPPGLQVVVDHVLTSDPAYWALTRLASGLLVRTILATPVSVFEGTSAAERTRARAIIQDVLPVSRRAAGLAIDARITSSLPRYALDRITAPVLAVSYEDDLYGTWENARYTTQEIPGARFISYPSGGHVGLGHQEDVIRELTRFIHGDATGDAPGTGGP